MGACGHLKSHVSFTEFIIVVLQFMSSKGRNVPWLYVMRPGPQRESVDEAVREAVGLCLMAGVSANSSVAEPGKQHLCQSVDTASLGSGGSASRGGRA